MKIVKSIVKFTILTCALGVNFIANTPGHFAKAQPENGWPAINYSLVVQGLNRPVHITNAGDGSGRMFIVEQTGRVRIFEGSLQNKAFLDISDRIKAGTGEEGLLSIAFPPDYASKGHFYVYYTNKSGDNQVSRFRLSQDPNLADPDSEELILYLNHPVYENHNGGQIAFGPDGYLYIATGDGGGGGDPLDNAQNPASLLGKVLRIDVEYEPAPPTPTDIQIFLPIILHNASVSTGSNYRIPPDNPFVGLSGYREEIWALGLRNPWRVSFDTTTGDLYIADVGQSKLEEINYQHTSSSGGENYGWNIMEGKDCYLLDPCNKSGLTLPVYAYSHALGCSVTGGHVYRGGAQPSLQGIYFLADFCSGIIWGLRPNSNIWEGSMLDDTTFNISSFGLDESGELYFASLYDGSIHKISAVTP